MCLDFCRYSLTKYFLSSTLIWLSSCVPCLRDGASPCSGVGSEHVPPDATCSSCTLRALFTELVGSVSAVPRPHLIISAHDWGFTKHRHKLFIRRSPKIMQNSRGLCRISETNKQISVLTVSGSSESFSSLRVKEQVVLVASPPTPPLVFVP